MPHKKKDGEFLLDCRHRFKVPQKVFIPHAGSLIHLAKLIEAYPDYDTRNSSKHDKLKKKAGKRLATYFYLVNSNQNKHSNILINLSS